MAINSLILELSAKGIPATMELPGGGWCHTPEYIKRRYSGGIKSRPAPKPKQDDFMELLSIDLSDLTRAERALLLAKLKEE